MSEGSHHHGPGFEDPTAPSAQSNPTFFRTMFGMFLLICALNFLSYIWSAQWNGRAVSDVGLMEHKEQVENPRWGWKPFRIEYRLYLDRGYDLSWMEKASCTKAREWLGNFAPFFELFFLRLYGFYCFALHMGVILVFALSLGSIRYYTKRFYFEHVSSTFNNASIKFLFWGIPLVLLWATFPFGVEIPILGEVPILTVMPVLGPVWLSSPLLGASMFTLLFSFAAFTLGANFSREI